MVWDETPWQGDETPWLGDEHPNGPYIVCRVQPLPAGSCRLGSGDETPCGDETPWFGMKRLGLGMKRPGWGMKRFGWGMKRIGLR